MSATNTLEARDSKTVRLSAVGASVVAVVPLVLLMGTRSLHEGVLLWSALTWFLVLGSIALLSVRSPLDRTHPLVWSGLAMLVMYSIHPWAVVDTGAIGRPYQATFAIAQTYEEAVRLGAVATASMYLGFAVAAALRRRADAHTSSRTARPSGEAAVRGLQAHERSILWGARLSLVGAILGYAAFTAATGQGFTAAVLNGAQRGSVDGSSAYLYLSPQLLGPAGFLYLLHAKLRKALPVAAPLIMLTQLLLFVPTGQRFVLLTSLVPTLILWLFLKDARLSALKFAGMAALAVIVTISLRDLSSFGETSVTDSLAATVNDPRSALTEFATGPDTEMVDGLAVEIQYVPSVLSYSPGNILLSTVSAPVPRALWPEKPSSADSELNFVILGVERNNASVAYGFVGELYFEGGALAVALGFMLYGIACQRFNELRKSRTSAMAYLLAIAILPLTVSLLRGSLALILARSLFTVGPILFVYFAVRVKARG